MFRPHGVWLSLLCVIAVGLPSRADVVDPSLGRPDEKQPLLWYDIRHLGIEGQGWTETKAPFDRLPGRAETTVRKEVWNLSRHSTGLCVRFVADVSAVHARWTLTSDRLAMPHMPATGVSGLDLYVRRPDGRWHWAGVGRPGERTNTQLLASGLATGSHEFLLYLPLYNGVSSVEIGLPREARLRKAPPRHPDLRKPLVFYGTSITQGGCASRPGMVHTSILHRRLERPVINLGFSGNGRMETEVGALMAEIDAAVYVIDCLPNMDAKAVAERTEPLVRVLRATRPRTPILLVEDRSYTNAAVVAGARQRNTTNRTALRQAFEKLVRDGDDHLHYLEGAQLLGDDGEGAVDGSHPTDLGFVRQADAMQTVLMPLLPKPVLRSDRRPIEGYASKLSVVAGETIGFHISTIASRYSLEIARVGAEREVVWREDNLEGRDYPVPANASANGCGWPEARSLRIPATWRSGYYAGRLSATGADGKPIQSELFFIVRPSEPGKTTKILLQLSTNTYNAYTNWGGYSLYAYHAKDHIQGRRVSFDRPQYSQYGNWELPFVQWAERNGYRLDFCANSDLEFHPDLLRSYRLILSLGHDEYWSAPMRDNLERFIGAGGNAAFFSGNTCCWQVRSEAGGRALTCWKQAYKEDPYYVRGKHDLLSSLWSHHLVKRPENTLTGVGFLWGGYHRSHGQFMEGSGAFTVHRPDHWLFKDTGLKRGDAFGGKDTVVGYECDGCELTWKDGLPFPTFRDGTPTTFVPLATSPARWHPDDSEWYERWEKGRTGQAVVGVYTRGGTVVTTGTTDWSHGLRGNDPAVVRITKNVLDRLSR